MYGHLDKQPPLTGEWEEGLGPYTPVIRDNKLYGRGGADDGYSSFASIAALKFLQEQKFGHGRIVIMIEASEESSEEDLMFYIQSTKQRLGNVSLVICLDSGCGNYEQMWLTSSLRGVIGGSLSVSLLSESVHSGSGTGLIASSFRVLRILLDRLEDSETGKILLKDLFTEVSQSKLKRIEESSEVLGKILVNECPLLSNVKLVSDNFLELVLNRTWRPQLAVTGASGFPTVELAGNVLRKESSLKLSIRIPPGVDGEKATNLIEEVLTKDPPYGSHVKFDRETPSNGWSSPEEKEWLLKSVNSSSQSYFGKPCGFMGEGGTIPFISYLGETFPNSQFVVTGVLGAGSNAHGPNEMLDLNYVKKLNCCIAQILFDFHTEFNKNK
eukprot:TRINITY_DN6948_c0_g1_i2.p1 TRINITY_DN6948_c0_g1~~TRINITY_DN6948_c0_g1_i2.p1  ORF type:complete len:384 (-),score=120.37 TRINITY_DN6948_c0_g1_i2:14-1165(-)